MFSFFRVVMSHDIIELGFLFVRWKNNAQSSLLSLLHSGQKLKFVIQGKVCHRKEHYKNLYIYTRDDFTQNLDKRNTIFSLNMPQQNRSILNWVHTQKKG